MAEHAGTHASKLGRATPYSLLLVLVLGMACTAALARPGGESLEARIIEIAAGITPSVVHIEAIVKVNDQRKKVGGSGVLVDADGAIITNEHVIDRAQKVEVTVPGFKKKFLARVVGSDRQTDIALLQIEADVPLAAAPLGSADNLRVGQWVLAVGNPYGLEGTVSFGIVSAKGRNLEIPHLLNDFIQTDAMIDRGSSGGPLVDLEGRVVGINSRGRGRGIGFTIPVETALDVIAQIRAGGIERGFLGVSMQPLDRELADYLGVPDLNGVMLNSVVPNSPAEHAGLRVGDVLVRLDEADIEAEKEEDLGTFQRRVAAVAPGHEIILSVWRDGAVRDVAVTMASQPRLDPDEVETALGFHVQEINEYIARDHRLDSTKGTLVSFVAQGSPAREAGLRGGDVITRIEDFEVEDLDDLRKAMESAETLARFLVVAQRGDETLFLILKTGTEHPGADRVEATPGPGSKPRGPAPHQTP